MAKRTRPRPNILVTGTPGCGKTSLASALAAATGLAHLDVGAAIRDQGLHSGWDEEFQCHIVDEDKARRAHAARRATSVPHSRPPPAPRAFPGL